MRHVLRWKHGAQWRVAEGVLDGGLRTSIGGRSSLRACRGLFLGLVVLTAGLTWSGLSASAGSLIVSRGIAGLGAGFVFPATLATLSGTLVGAWKDRAVSIWAASVMLGGALGIAEGAAMLEVAWWGASFLVVAGLGVLSLALALVVVPETKDSDGASVDPLGSFLSIVAVGGGLVLGITEGPPHGWTSPGTLTALLIGGAAAPAFVCWDLRAERPLVDLRALRDRTLGASSASIFVVFLADFGLAFILFQFARYVFGYNSLRCALLLMLGAVTFAPCAFAGPPLAQRLGLRVVLAAGMTTCAAATTLLALVGSSSIVYLTIGLMILYGGLGLVMTPATQAIIEAYPAAEQGAASALNDIMRELGAAIGIAVLGAGFSAGYRYRVTDLGHSGLPGGLFSAIERSPALGLEAITRLGGSPQDISILRNSVNAGWRAAMVLATFSLLVGVAVTLWRLRPETSTGPVHPEV
ncbi:MAG TPA: MFS transporter [Acidimicrobiales bacterium]|nr:MFS transporter [Acidimicrobiales bacterium]